jgi:phosphoribosylformylglycinamidine synthase
MSVDKVSDAVASPKAPQPFAELGLKKDEYKSIREILGRRPTSSELAMYSVMWSEHCSYKSSKVHLRQFGTKVPKNDSMLVGIGENAGVVDIGHGWAVTFKVESHNHPSYRNRWNCARHHFHGRASGSCDGSASFRRS